MKVEVYPSKVSGRIKPPASKSYLHRSIICASLSSGISKISNIIYSEDVNATLGVFENLGVSITRHKNSIEINSKGFQNFQQEKMVYCNESGSTIRFLIPVLSNNYNTYFTGKSGLMSRPFTVYKDIFISQGLVYKQESTEIMTKGSLKPGEYIVPGNISSQFISGLLFILPTLNGDSTIKITGKLESEEYVDMTVEIMRIFKVKIEKSGQSIFVSGNQKYVSTNINAEIDYSQMAFFAVLGIINNTITVDGINSDSLQPDRRITGLIQNMGGKVIKEEDSITFSKSKTNGITIDVSQSPDLAPILGVLASCSKGETRLVNARRLIIKESNRVLFFSYLICIFF